jgi:hypothetical protein
VRVGQLCREVAAVWYERRRRHPRAAIRGESRAERPPDAPVLHSRFSAKSRCRQPVVRNWVHTGSLADTVRQHWPGRAWGAPIDAGSAAQPGGIAIAPAGDFHYVTGHVERGRPLPSHAGAGDTVPGDTEPAPGKEAYAASASRPRAASLDQQDRQVVSRSQHGAREHGRGGETGSRTKIR